MALDLSLLGERTLTVDCDVLQADGGTRTAAVTGGWVAVALALRPLIETGELPPEVLARQIAAISVGLVDGVPLLDLAYEEDVRAEVDFNVVMAGDNQLVEVQGTAEKSPFTRVQLDALVDLAAAGIVQLLALQNAVVSDQ
jgi:ribonuclease PH